MEDRFQVRVRSASDMQSLRRAYRPPRWMFWTWFNRECWVIFWMLGATAALFVYAFRSAP